MSYTNTQAFEQACTHYNDAKAMIADWLSLSESLQSFEDIMKNYDYILQGILLHVTLSDGYFFECEKLFIRHITDYGDVIKEYNLLKGAAETPISWDKIGDLPDETKAMLASEIMLTVSKRIDEFIRLFASINRNAHNRGFLQEIKDCIFPIVLDLAMVDGDDGESSAVKNEFAAGCRIFADLIENRWRTMMVE